MHSIVLQSFLAWYRENLTYVGKMRGLDWLLYLPRRLLDQVMSRRNFLRLEQVTPLLGIVDDMRSKPEQFSERVALQRLIFALDLAHIDDTRLKESLLTDLWARLAPIVGAEIEITPETIKAAEKTMTAVAPDYRSLGKQICDSILVTGRFCTP